jgi:lycopene cyclase domain-containing protein
MPPLYPTLSILAAGTVVALERYWWQTGLFRQKAYWLALTIVIAFMVPIDGWMSKLSDPIVIYDPDQLSGIRFPWDIPIEEFVYAFAVVTLAMLLWDRAAEREERPRAHPTETRSEPRSEVSHR